MMDPVSSLSRCARILAVRDTPESPPPPVASCCTEPPSPPPAVVKKQTEVERRRWFEVRVASWLAGCHVHTDGRRLGPNSQNITKSGARSGT